MRRYSSSGRQRLLDEQLSTSRTIAVCHKNEGNKQMNAMFV